MKLDKKLNLIIMMKNKYKEIYLFYEFKNLILTSIKNIFIKEKENQKKEKEKQKKLKEKENNEKGKEKDKQNKKRKTNSFENPKNNGIKGIIRVVSKKENLLNQNNVFHIDSYDNNRSNIHIFIIFINFFFFIIRKYTFFISFTI